MTVREVAKYLQISQRKLEYLMAEGKIPFVRIGRSVRFDADVLQEWLKQLEVPVRNLAETSDRLPERVTK
ncbi:MAG: excisionase family DNA-binding protein [Verrucomicrobiae bacterium]|nr:excisionase family DNA-binding protein [Verrucomicrobiae bacterium]